MWRNSQAFITVPVDGTFIYIAYIKTIGEGTVKLTLKVEGPKERYSGPVFTEGISKRSYFWCDKNTFVSHF